MHDEYEELFATFALDDTVLSADPRETIRHLHDAHSTLGSLPLLHLANADAPDAELRVGRTLGEGGMGVIRAATQAPFGREVALKTVRADRAAEHAVALSLLREAIAAGRLEHPNIIPIYAVGRDAEDRPVIVMKRIDGAAWRDFVVHPERVPSDDVLEWHLRTFMQVCAAVHFAHLRGVIHRDIKLDNVMVGPHEDVYVVDWGLAMTLMPDPARQLPDVGQVNDVVGTPAYMAPEMAAGGTLPLDERTDVYLLGAMLHEILTGEPRHHGRELYEIMLNAYKSEAIDYGGSVPPELAAICNKATSCDPDQRFATALALRDAVQRYLDHRGAAALTADASDQLGLLIDALSTPEEGDDDDRRVVVYRLYGAARFGFERSLSQWPDQPAAGAGLQRTLEAMIDWELSHGSVHAADALLAELPEFRPELDARIRELERSLSAEKAELEALREREHQLDVRVGQRGRAFQAGLLIMGGMILPALASYVLDFPTWFTQPLFFWLVAVAACLSTIIFIAVGWRRPEGWFSLARTQTNRRIAISIVIVCVYLIAFRGLAMLGGVPVPLQFALELCAFAMFTATLATFLDRQLAGSAIIYVFFTILAFVFPAYATICYLAGNTGALAWVIWVWRDPD